MISGPISGPVGRIIVCAGLLIPGVSLAIRAEAKTVCLPDNASVEMFGIVHEVSGRDKHSGRLYSYFTIDAEQFYCVAGQDVDERSATPTYNIALTPREAGKDQKEFGPYVGYRVKVTGTLSSSSRGGPLLFDKTIERRTREN
ncbi:hypothetical protein [Acetobacter oeni]|uniref:DUF4431 domain-containing protein n=1 Tax=Acetobacter oeni TaxID=304077 RepID=A0A511XJ98_9PROT|nr:hypothetical protein [Acetobacter oeni]MBB3882791.1 hypothetical protein [Acetobacter oeni]NHO18882.1 hypothetical protein [Acetobacter oeni]GBR09535.1 hypothetical protein AA21952_2869 [Acetobacter oeni LMG 21952]GEN63023.1 hypothetical protein AOE01nite_12470 [Acetobacter oeni]